MATFTVTVPTGKVSDLVKALCLKYGYEVTNANAKLAHADMLKDLLTNQERMDAEMAINVAPTDIVVT